MAATKTPAYSGVKVRWYVLIPALSERRETRALQEAMQVIYARLTPLKPGAFATLGIRLFGRQDSVRRNLPELIEVGRAMRSVAGVLWQWEAQPETRPIRVMASRKAQEYARAIEAHRVAKVAANDTPEARLARRQRERQRRIVRRREVADAAT